MCLKRLRKWIRNPFEVKLTAFFSFTKHRVLTLHEYSFYLNIHWKIIRLQMCGMNPFYHKYVVYRILRILLKCENKHNTKFQRLQHHFLLNQVHILLLFFVVAVAYSTIHSIVYAVAHQHCDFFTLIIRNAQNNINHHSLIYESIPTIAD